MEAEDRTANYNVTLSRQLNFHRVSLCCNEDSESGSGLVIRKLQTKVNEEGPEFACSLSHSNWDLPLSKAHDVRQRPQGCGHDEQRPCCLVIRLCATPLYRNRPGLSAFNGAMCFNSWRQTDIVCTLCFFMLFGLVSFSLELYESPQSNLM